jgi:hypothetical protein
MLAAAVTTTINSRKENTSRGGMKIFRKKIWHHTLQDTVD